jgi:hypothetical protein
MAKGAPQPPKQGGHPQAKAPKKLSYPTVIHPDLYQRANFTLQASAFLQQLNLESPSPDVVARKRKQDENELDETPRGSDSERLARNMMAANGKMVVHNQMKLFVLPEPGKWVELMSGIRQPSEILVKTARQCLSLV